MHLTKIKKNISFHSIFIHLKLFEFTLVAVPFKNNNVKLTFFFFFYLGTTPARVEAHNSEVVTLWVLPWSAADRRSFILFLSSGQCWELPSV